MLIRYREQLDRLMKERDSVEQQLMQSSENMRKSVASEAEHRELLEQVQQLNLLRESNVVLREEAQR